MTASGTVYDFINGVNHDVSVAVSLTGTGDVFTQMDHSHVTGTGPGFTYKEDFFGSERAVTVAGTITLEGVAINPDQCFGSLGYVKDGTLSITKP